MIIKTKDGWKKLGTPINYKKILGETRVDDFDIDPDEWREGLKALNGDDKGEGGPYLS